MHEAAKLIIFLDLSLPFFNLYERNKAGLNRQRLGHYAYKYITFCLLDLLQVLQLMSSNAEIYLLLCFPFSCRVVQDHRILIPG
jgi:hypothetical protein